ncbi:hypothetical protein SNOG_13901 [Parastagonospora nodorum SN15]|uniref:Uncharacterized protein n=1 Tax=Phaeosphaeria nodorum (strain SN15 / ATCC MYA-4574 / FGSC 10173) TaxID=321614 RepID=Q0U2N3_PHANO|nr:hypothetical protein SNOG_13901 [Parastagonospora nodorum SN15]EAT78526.1 hypothetical protein SNOG_13901 [Parastagonospora nodorum SN15]
MAHKTSSPVADRFPVLGPRSLTGRQFICRQHIAHIIPQMAQPYPTHG